MRKSFCLGALVAALLFADPSHGDEPVSMSPAMSPAVTLPPVYPEPPKEELDTIALPKVREKILEMVAIDQYARKTGK